MKARVDRVASRRAARRDCLEDRVAIFWRGVVVKGSYGLDELGE